MKKIVKTYSFLTIILLFTFFSCVPDKKGTRVGFDVDDTILFSTPAFQEALKKYTFKDKEFWVTVNSLDEKLSVVKKGVEKIINNYKKNKIEIFVITARPKNGGENLKNFLNKRFNIPKKNIFFEPNGKTKRIKELKLDIFYGDSDSDIKDAQDAGIKGIRILRNPNSSYKDKNGKLQNYNPGKFNEYIIPDSEK